MPNLESVPILDSTPTPRKRLFEAGEMKLLVLHFIAESPKYSYDIIKSIANLVGGNYKPSTGTICPTINYLEEQGFTQVQMSADDRKQYHITALGQKYLAEQKSQIEKTLERFNTRKQIQSNAAYTEIKQAMEQLKHALRLKLHTELNAAQIHDIAQYIEQAAQNIQQRATDHE